MLKNRVVLAAFALSIAASGALAAAGPAQAGTSHRGSAVRVVTADAASTIATITVPKPGTIAPDDSCWD
jgi:multidrug efflux pump subunit AcrA (membrane-fusion protein)